LEEEASAKLVRVAVGVSSGAILLGEGVVASKRDALLFGCDKLEEFCAVNAKIPIVAPRAIDIEMKNTLAMRILDARPRSSSLGVEGV
jgi:hypothetical protein